MQDDPHCFGGSPLILRFNSWGTLVESTAVEIRSELSSPGHSLPNLGKKASPLWVNEVSSDPSSPETTTSPSWI